MKNRTDKKVLFISHDASRTGAPIIFLNFLEWFKNNSEIPFRILLKGWGDLETRFQALAPVNIFYNKQLECGWHRWSIMLPAIRPFSNRFHFNNLRRELFQDDIGLVYSNTVTNGGVLQFLVSLKCPVITHVHELESEILKSGLDNWELVKKYTNHYIAVSDAVKQNLIINHSIPEKYIDVVHGFIPISTLNLNLESRNNQREALNIPKDALIVGSSGVGSWRKGKDLFVQLAVNVVRKFKDKPIHFVWVGGRMKESEFYEIEHDISHAGISDIIHFIEHVSNPLDYYAEFDIFAMISREDPFPLVNLEVAALGKPIVCFDKAGGTPEFVENDAGFVVPYLDIDVMADKIIDLARNEELRNNMGRRSFEKAVGNHDISVGAQKISNIIERFL
jgi:glycosyltransferase involved in cell wall biosynthesis